jgi:hypothetical protein
MDQTRDLSGQQFYRLTRLYPPPEFVKKADVTALCGDSDMPPDAYGDPIHRMYPCHSQAATWASMAFFLDKKAEHKPKDAEVIEQRIIRFADYHGIPNAIDELQKKASSLTKEGEVTLSDEDFALVFTEGTDKQRHFPLRNTKEVKTASAYLYKHRDFFPYNLRRDFADRVLQKAAQYGAALGETSDYIERQAGHGACATKTAVDMLRDRVKAAQKGPGPFSDVQKQLLVLADMFEQHPSRLREPGVRVKLASVVDDYDRATGVYRDYGNKLLRPEDVLFELTSEKMASVIRDHCSTTTGMIYKLADVEKLRIDDVRDNLGSELADALKTVGPFVDGEKAAEIIPTMDRGLAEMFDQLMISHGNRPMAKEASAESLGLSRSYLQELAGDHLRQEGKA